MLKLRYLPTNNANKINKYLAIYNNYTNVHKYSSDSKNVEDTNKTEQQISGFAKAFDKFLKPIEVKQEEKTFASLLKNSKFIDLGDPVGKTVIGKIFHVVEDDLYIDFGWKFYCVCPRPGPNSQKYIRGARVKLQIKDLELSTRFLGANKDLTLLEADAYIIGLADQQQK